MQLGPAEILVVLVIALLVFGPTRLPEVGRQVGRAMRELRKFQHTVGRDVHEVFNAGEPHDASKAAEPSPTLPPKAADDAPSTSSETPDRPGDSSTAGEKTDGT